MKSEETNGRGRHVNCLPIGLPLKSMVCRVEGREDGKRVIPLGPIWFQLGREGAGGKNTKQRESKGKKK